MKMIMDFVVGFFCCVFAILGFSGIKNMFANSSSKKRAKKVISQYEKIDSSDDTRSDLDVLRKL